MTEAERLTRRWLDECVLALGLCPFAAPVLRDTSLRITVCEASNAAQQLRQFEQELALLQRVPEAEVSTTLLVYDTGLEDFMLFLERLEQCQIRLQRAGLEGVIQLASFHPHYLFAGEPEQALSHYTNRSPRPTIHLLRENMLSKAIERYPDTQDIPVNNMALLEEMGAEQVEELWQRVGVTRPPD
ncbi:DUF1415 domain-containing protein [Halieaceae bacterium IMCC14734]|uniref:DUF1415 domain-containing protein n=1 Tax=Candidatus Litorirhabdus singularis TaxID=2518993 RepID=A0ABT3TCI8_9GAMM|nr:DUF1415 domain-containing protein [Candidatus Litorirhabdus singularis]MCX2980008.1 DUF1415 domain-containing protein [Candidatus Litorirhabdus singularis]